MDFLGRTENLLPNDTPNVTQPRKGERERALHEARMSLPLWKWTDMTAEALVTHFEEER